MHSQEYSLALFFLLLFAFCCLKKYINTQSKQQGQVTDDLPFESFDFHPNVDPLAIASSLILRTLILFPG